MCFVDFEKAFDMVRHEILVERLRRLGVDTADLRVMTNLYWGQRAVVKIGYEKSDWVKIERGARQGCVLSPELFSLYLQAVMDEMADLEGIKVGGMNVNNIRYVDDTVLIVDTEEKLQRLVDRLDEECRRVGLKINIGKTDVMGVTKRKEQLRMNVNIDGQAVKQGRSFRYLGSLVDKDGRSDVEIRSRIEKGKTNFGQMRILTSRNLSTGIRLRILKTYTWSVMLYGCETWTVSKEMKKRLDAAEMWFIRRIMRVPWVARTNLEELQMASTTRELMTTVKRRQLGYLGHVLKGDGLEKDCLLGMIEEKRAWGRQRMRYMDGIKEMVGREKMEVVELAGNRRVWHSIVANVIWHGTAVRYGNTLLYSNVTLLAM
uniref:Reverse transcriptase domain-containing protein n=1 Tax=Scylla olivacea TaxID=85551 RepID=A0A0P4W0B7_SCYOL